MGRRRTGLALLGMVVPVLLGSAAVTSDACAAEPEAPRDSATRDSATPTYTLVVDSDEVGLSYESLASRLAAELGGTVVAASPGLRPARVAIAIHYAQGLLTVRAEHVGDRVLERSIRAEGDATVVQREALLLASNLAHDEARELLDELARRPRPADQAPSPLPSPKSESAEVEGPHHPATLALVYPIASNMGDVGDSAPFNLGVFYGRVGRSEAFQLTFGGISHATKSVSGAQIGTLASISGGRAFGAQISAGANYASGPVEGAQVTAIFNHAGELDGFQGSQGVNVVGGPMVGAQVSALGNVVAGNARGTQLAAGLNLATERFGGAQIATVNVANEVHGMQLGLVNVARRGRGLQVGIVNIVDEPAEALGIVTIARDAIHPIAWASNLAYTNAGIKFMSRHLYSVAAIGFGSREADFDSGPSLTVAAGGHVPLPSSFDVEIELAYTHLEGVSEQNQSLHPRVLAGYTFAKHLRLFAGSGARIPLAFDRGSPAVRPEFVGGVQF